MGNILSRAMNNDILKVLKFQCPSLESFISSGLKVAQRLVIGDNSKQSAMEFLVVSVMLRTSVRRGVQGGGL